MLHHDSHSGEWIDSLLGDIRVVQDGNGWVVTTRAANWHAVSRHRLLERAKRKALTLIRKRA